MLQVYLIQILFSELLPVACCMKLIFLTLTFSLHNRHWITFIIFHRCSPSLSNLDLIKLDLKSTVYILPNRAFPSLWVFSCQSLHLKMISSDHLLWKLCHLFKTQEKCKSHAYFKICFVALV